MWLLELGFPFEGSRIYNTYKPKFVLEFILSSSLSSFSCLSQSKICIRCQQINIYWENGVCINVEFFEAVQILMLDFQQQYVDEDKNVLSKYLLF